jgi:hypothetical protein
MFTRKISRTTFILTLVAVILTACGRGQAATPTATMVPTGTPTVVPTLTSTSKPEPKYLSELMPQLATVGWGKLSIGHYEVSSSSPADRIIKGNPIVMHEVEYSYGIFAHAPSRIVYDLGGIFFELQVRIGILDWENCGDGAQFIILLDGNEIYRSPTILAKSDPIDVRVDVTGGQRLELITDPGIGGNIQCDCTVWGNPILDPLTSDALPSAPTPTQLPNPSSSPTLIAISLSPSAPYSLTPKPLPILGKFQFQEASSFGYYAIPAVFPADLDKDGDIDLVLASEENDSIIQVYENLGNAVFRNTGDVLPFQSPDNRHWNFGITVADFNEDGLPDIATADAWAGMNIYFNMGGLRFAWSQNYVFPGMGEVKGIASADLNHDGHIDIILGVHNGSSMGDRILFNDGNGRMVDTNQSINQDITMDVFAIDLNQDGAPDYISVSRYAESPARLNFNNGAGIFDHTIDVPDSLDDSYKIKCFSQRDFTYCFIANSEGSTETGVRKGRQNRELVFDKTGVLILDKKFGRIGAETKDLCIVDINSDGNPDLIAANYNGESYAYLASFSGGGLLNFDEVVPLFAIAKTGQIGCADFNGDGAIDIVLGVGSEEVMTRYRLFLGQPSS